jgi:uncharacterized protein YcfJ
MVGFDAAQWVLLAGPDGCCSQALNLELLPSLYREKERRRHGFCLEFGRKQSQGAIMKKTILFSAMGVLSAFGTVAGAQEFGRVLSSTPVIQQVAVPRQICGYQPIAVQQPNSGAGGVVGALAGGAIGNQIGHGDGRAVATILGVIGGALLGNQIESNNNAPQVQNVQNCSTQTYYENRTVGYNVQYEYAGKQYNVQMPNDPGPTIRLQLTPMSDNSAAADMAGPSAPGSPGVIVAPPVAPPVTQAAIGQPIAHVVGVPQAYPAYPVYPAYPGYYARPYPYYPPIGLSLNFGFSSGHRHHHRWR